MKHLKYFESDSNFKFNIGDVVKHVNTNGGYLGSRFNIIERETLIGKNGYPDRNLYTLEYQNKFQDQPTSKYFGTEFEDKLILIPKYELDAEKYNL